MIKKTITYEDWNGTTRTEDFYFNLTRVECAEMEFGLVDGPNITETITSLINAQDMKAVIALIKKLILTAYGEKSSDGKRFMKSDAIREAFEQNPAFDIIYMDLATNADAAADFVVGILPNEFREGLGNNPKARILNSVKTFEENGHL